MKIGRIRIVVTLGKKTNNDDDHKDNHDNHDTNDTKYRSNKRMQITILI